MMKMLKLISARSSHYCGFVSLWTKWMNTDLKASRIAGFRVQGGDLRNNLFIESLFCRTHERRIRTDRFVVFIQSYSGELSCVIILKLIIEKKNSNMIRLRILCITVQYNAEKNSSSMSWILTHDKYSSKHQTSTFFQECVESALSKKWPFIVCADWTKHHLMRKFPVPFIDSTCFLLSPTLNFIYIDNDRKYVLSFIELCLEFRSRCSVQK